MQLRLVLICGLLWLSGIGGLAAQAPTDASDRNWHPQYDLFQLLLEEQGLETIRSVPLALAAPGTTVIVVASEDGTIPRVREDELTRFVEDGGAVILMSS